MDRKHSNKASNAGHEPNAINVRAVWLSAAGLLAVVVVSFLLMAELLKFLSGTAATPRPVAAMEHEAPPMPAGVPKLNPNQTVKLNELRATERQLLHQYTWLDRPAGLARIPIDRAIEIISASGLPETVG